MIKNYLKIAWRNLLRDKTHTCINMLGLSLGVALAILIGTWVWDEVTFDRHAADYQQIARVMLHTEENGVIETSNTVAAPLAEALRTQFHDLFEAVALARPTGDHVLNYGNQTLRRPGKFMSEEAPYILPLVFINGNGHSLSDPKAIVLSQSMANSLFKAEDPMGKMIKVDNQMLVKVTGIYQDFPANSSFTEIHYLLPWKLLTHSNTHFRDLEKSWEFNWFEVFVKVADNRPLTAVSQQIAYLQRDLLKDNSRLNAKQSKLSLHPISKWHLYNKWENGKNSGGSIQYVWLFILFGVFVLLLAAVNFMNLATAQYERRAKEVAIRKAIGSVRKQLIVQFLCESLLMALICFVIAIVLAQLAIPFFNKLANKELLVPYRYPYFWLMSLGFTLLLGLLSGSYPAFFLSSFKPVKILKGVLGSSNQFPRRTLVVFQYTVSISFMISTFIILQQIKYAKDRTTGYDRNELISFRMTHFNGRNEAFHHELIKTGFLSGVTQATSPATDSWSNASGFYWEGKDPTLRDDFSLVAISPSYGKTMGWKITAGRDFSADFVSDSSAVILNKSAVDYMGLGDPIGKTIRWKDETFNDQEYLVIGVVENMVTQSPYEPVKQSIFFMQPAANFLLARLKPGINKQAALLSIQQVFKKHVPDEAFEYTFVADAYAQKFSTEEQIAKLTATFTVLTFLISCMGIFGLASFATAQRRKEIGIRKVFGARMMQLMALLSADFMKLVFIALVLAIPLAYWAMNWWLSQFAYRIESHWWVFTAAGLITLTIAFITISFQTAKAALANPVDSLRNE